MLTVTIKRTTRPVIFAILLNSYRQITPRALRTTLRQQLSFLEAQTSTANSHRPKVL
jgi:hypothetical protein